MTKRELREMIRKELKHLIKEQIKIIPIKLSVNNKITLERWDESIYIINGKKEICFSDDKETVNYVIKALNTKKIISDKKSWTAITSDNGDIMVIRQKNSNNIKIIQCEDNGITIQLNANLIDILISKIKKIAK